MRRSPLFSLCLVAMSAAAQDATVRPSRLIDMHFHVWDQVPTGPARDSLLAAFREFHLEKALASGPVAHIIAMVAMSPERMLGAPAFTESIALPPIAVLRAHYRAGRLAALGEIDAQYAGERLDAAWLEPYWALSEALDIPVAIHTGFAQPRTPYTCCPKFRTSLGNPQHFEGVLVRHPRMRVYLMHAGWPYLEETKAIMHMYPQVYADLAGFAFNPGIPREEFYGYLQALLRAGFANRLMFGSGLSPADWRAEIATAIALVEEAPFLTSEQKAGIFYDNAARFLRLASPVAR